MAERWQQWMPHDIDAWQGSANVQALSDLAYRAVHNLILDMWKQSDCALPIDDRELAKRSRVMGRWAECRDEVLEYFSDRTETGKITHRVTLRKWNEAREIYEKRQEAAKKTNAQRSGHGDRSGDRDASVTLTPRSGDTGTSTSTGTTTQEQKQKPSRGKREGPNELPMFTVFRGLVVAWWNSAGNEHDPPWDGSEAKKLSALMAANPKLGPDGMRRLLEYRARSHGVNLAERPRKWLESLTDYARGPLNQFKQPEGTDGTNRGDQPQRVSPAVQRGRESRSEIRAAGALLYGIGIDDADGAGSGPVSKSAIASGDAGYVPGGVGRDGNAVRVASVQGCVIEGNP